jgi:hypothetical protein
MTYGAADVRSIEEKFAGDLAARLSNPFHTRNPVLLGRYGIYGSAQVTDVYMVCTDSRPRVEYRSRIDPHHPNIKHAIHPTLPPPKPSQK